MIEPYSVAAIQTRIRHVRKGVNQHKTIKENLYRSIALIDYAAVRFGAAKLVVLPEFWLTGADHGRSVQDWTEVAPQVPGWASHHASTCQHPLAAQCSQTQDLDTYRPALRNAPHAYAPPLRRRRDRGLETILCRSSTLKLPNPARTIHLELRVRLPIVQSGV